jgi:tight adherence protein C
MLAVAVGAFAFLAVALAVTVAWRYLESRQSPDHRRAVRRLRELGGAPAAEVLNPDRRGDWLVRAGARLGGWLMPRSGSRVADLGSRLALAGYRDPSAVLYFTVFQFAAVLALGMGFGGMAWVWGVAWKKAVLWTAVGGAVGLIAPTFLLSARIKKRQLALRNALPDALDIMVLSVEGGASLNAAMTWAAEEIQAVHPLLGVELHIVQREVQLGLSVGEALRGFADRCEITEVRDLAAAILQSERYGASVGKTLRSYADGARADRQMWAEEVAQKAAVKIIFPMLLCIFPAIFIVLLGPAAMQMSKLFAR